MFYTSPFVRVLPNLWTGYIENEWTNFDANWHMWSVRQGCETDRLWGSGGQRSVSYSAEMGHKNPFWRDISRTI